MTALVTFNVDSLLQLGRAGARARGARRRVRERDHLQDLPAGIAHPHHRRHHRQPPGQHQGIQRLNRTAVKPVQGLQFTNKPRFQSLQFTQ